jgi:hypothetical protein
LRGNERMLGAVLDASADLTGRDQEGRTPLDIARAAKRPKLVAMMAVRWRLFDSIRRSRASYE